MQLFLHFYPAVMTMLSLYFYRRDSCRMQNFYRRMALSISTRKFFVLILMLISLSFNFCFLQSYGVNAALGISSILCFAMLSFRMSERGIYWLQNRLGLSMIFAAMLICVVKPDIWPLSMNLFIFTVGSMFYPSAKLMRQLESPESFSRFAAHPATVIEGYYSR